MHGFVGEACSLMYLVSVYLCINLIYAFINISASGVNK